MNAAGQILLTLMQRGATSRTSLPALLCEDACSTLPVTGVGIALMDADGLVARAAASGPLASSLEELQLSLGEGPALDAYGSGRLVLVPDLATQDPGRWPVYTTAALEQGVRAVMAYPLRIGGIRLGVFSMYRAEPGMLDDAGLARALQYADAAVLILLHLQSLNGHQDATDSPIEVAFPGLPEVHQATGMVSAQVGVDLKDALLLLQTHAFAEGVPIAEVSRAVVDRKFSFHRPG